jgi:1-acyl-sn-glycerol-3-phosphate acyltransferase
MNFIKNIVGRFYALYALLIFVITLIPTYLCLRVLNLFLSAATFEKYFHRGMQLWMGVYMPLIFCRVLVVGKEKFEKGKNYVVVLNHNSLIDIPVSTPGIPAPNKTLGKSDFLKMPFFGFIYACGSVIINRKELRSKQDSYRQLLKVLSSGMHVCLYPEGTRNKTTLPLQPFKDGAFKLAIEGKKPLMVGVIQGTKQIMTVDKIFHAWPHAVRISFLEVIQVEDVSFGSEKLLNAKAFKIMKAELLK